MLLDLYGGFGAYSLAAAAHFEKVIIVDGNGHAIDAARQTCLRLGITNVTAVHASVEDYLAKRLKADDRQAVTHIIVNPPRTGVSESAREELGRTHFPALEELTYVSCDLPTLSRDLDVITRKGRLRLAAVTPFDMFPQTDHIEVVARLSR